MKKVVCCRFFLWWKRSTKTHKTLIKYHFKHVHDVYYVVSAPIPCTGCIPFWSSSYSFFNDLEEWTKAKVNSSFWSFRYRHDVDNTVLSDYILYICIYISLQYVQFNNMQLRMDIWNMSKLQQLDQKADKSRSQPMSFHRKKNPPYRWTSAVP